MSDVVTKGQKVKVKVLSFTGTKASLSMKVRTATGAQGSWTLFGFNPLLSSDISAFYSFSLPAYIEHSPNHMMRKRAGPMRPKYL